MTSFAACVMARLAAVALVLSGGGSLALADAAPASPDSATPGSGPTAPNQPSVTWQAPDVCPDADSFATLIARYLGNSTAATGVKVTVTVVAAEAGFHLTWRMESEDGFGERTLDGPDCGLLAETAALTLALAIDPNAGTEVVDEAAIFHGDEERPPNRTGPTSPNIDLARPVPPRRSGPPLGVAFRLMGGTTVGALPGLAPSLGAAIAARSRHWRLELGFSYWFEKRATILDQEDEGGDFSIYSGSFRACGDLVGSLVSACLGGEAGKMRGSGFGFDLPETNSSLWLAATGAVAASWRIANHWFLRADLQIALPKDRPKFVRVPGGEVIHQPGPVSGRLFTGLELQFL